MILLLLASQKVLASLQLRGLPAAVDVGNVSIVSAAVLPTVNYILVASCEFLLLLLASLLSVARCSTAPAVILDVNGANAVVGL
jgi:hypothetical protein